MSNNYICSSLIKLNYINKQNQAIKCQIIITLISKKMLSIIIKIKDIEIVISNYYNYNHFKKYKLCEERRNTNRQNRTIKYQLLLLC